MSLSEESKSPQKKQFEVYYSGSKQFITLSPIIPWNLIHVLSGSIPFFNFSISQLFLYQGSMEFVVGHYKSLMEGMWKPKTNWI